MSSSQAERDANKEKPLVICLNATGIGPGEVATATRGEGKCGLFTLKLLENISDKDYQGAPILEELMRIYLWTRNYLRRYNKTIVKNEDARSPHATVVTNNDRLELSKITFEKLFTVPICGNPKFMISDE